MERRGALLMKLLVVILIACPCRSWRMGVCICVCTSVRLFLCERVLCVIYAKLQIVLMANVESFNESLTRPTGKLSMRQLRTA